MTTLLNRIHARVGDLWWYTILLFFVQRFGDVINMFVGLWIVPKYVPMKELGAVMPLTNIVSVLGIPLTIVAIPFLKFVAVFAEKKEFGKVKSLIRDTFIGTGIFAFLTILISYFILPLFFERLRVENGSLAFLLVTITILGAVSSITGNAVSALKMFSETIWYGAITAPVRLIIMVVLMPFRPLSGYVAGGAASPVVGIIGPFIHLRRFMKSSIKSEPYWKEYGRDILMYTWPLILSTVVTSVCSNMDMLVIRHRLCEFESAGYYMITRFSDIAMQLGSVFAAFLMPMLAGKNGHDSESRKMILHSTAGVMVVGLTLSTGLWIFGEKLLSLKSEWANYASLSHHMAGFSVISTLAMTGNCIVTAFIARGCFSFLWYVLPILLFKSLFLYALTGYTYFVGILPEALINNIAAFNPCRLSVVMWTIIIADILNLSLQLIHTFSVHQHSSIRPPAE